jgi:hypothetical protein
MKTIIKVNDKFSVYTNFFSHLIENYNDIGDLISDDRNEVKLVKTDGVIFVVKYYKRLTIANRYIYAFFRKSKAQRAYENTEWLRMHGITSPQNVAYVDRYQYGMLTKGFYVSLYTNYKPVRELFELPLSEAEEGIKAFARFTHDIHNKGAFHHDYTLSNVLYSYDGSSYDFSLIDNNRMRFSKHSVRKGLRTMERLEIPVNATGIVAAEYARVSGKNEFEMLNIMILIRSLHNLRTVLKDWVKIPLHYLIGKKINLPANLSLFWIWDAFLN